MPKWKSKYKEDQEKPVLIEQPPLVIVARKVWSPHPPPPENDINMGRMKLPCLDVVVTQTDGDDCKDSESCVQELRALQDHHIELGMSDIAYNFMICQDGTVFEGRGWTTKPYRLFNAQRHNANRESLMEFISIAFIGKFGDGMTGDRPVQAMCYALQDLINYGFDNGFLERGTISPLEENRPPPTQRTKIDVSDFE